MGCLGMGCCCAWTSVYIKYIVPRTRADLIKVPDCMVGLADAFFHGVASFMLNMAIGKSLVRNVLVRDWEERDGLKGELSLLASVWAGVFSIGTGLHALRFAFTDTDAASPMLWTWARGVVMQIFVVEPASIGFSVALPMLLAQIIGKKSD